MVGIGVACQTPGDSVEGDKSASTIPAAGPFAPAESVTAGRTVYLQKCARCHRFYDPAAYSEEDWSGWMRKMARKARLTPEQTTHVNQFLNSFRSSEAKSSG